MASGTRDQLQPSLLDRLTDDEPDRRVEARDRQVLSPQKLRQCVLRDLNWLLNTGNLATTENLEGHEEIVGSVLNYGMPDLAGVSVSSLDLPRLERSVHKAIADFEPRLKRNTLKVRGHATAEEGEQNRLVLEIEAELIAGRSAEHIRLTTEIDLENGQAAVTEASRG